MASTHPSVGDLFGALPPRGQALRQLLALVQVIALVQEAEGITAAPVEAFPLARVDAVLAAKYLQACPPGTGYLLRTAAALFSRSQIRVYESRFGKLANLLGFRQVALPTRERKTLLPPSEAEFARAHAAVGAMPENIQVVAALALYAGLRWIDLMRTHRTVVQGRVLVIDGVRRIPLPGWLPALLPPGQRLLLGNEAQRHATCCAAIAWLRLHLLPRESRPLLELRRYYMWYVATKEPPIVAMSRLGCRTLITIAPFLKARLSPAVMAEWERRLA